MRSVVLPCCWTDSRGPVYPRRAADRAGGGCPASQAPVLMACSSQHEPGSYYHVRDRLRRMRISTSGRRHFGHMQKLRNHHAELCSGVLIFIYDFVSALILHTGWYACQWSVPRERDARCVTSGRYRAYLPLMNTTSSSLPNGPP